MTTPAPTFVPGVELAPGGIWTDREQLRFGFSRSSGPGGQNVNKVNTKTELRISLSAIHGLNDRAIARLRTLAGRKLLPDGDLLLTADTERTQESNRRACLAKLRDLIEKARIEPKVRRKVKPSRAAKARRVDEKRKHAEKKRNRNWRE
jgi:ribosome-associated protein